MDQSDDLKAFEHRMIEIISSLQSSIWRWCFILSILIIIILIISYTLITDILFSLSITNDINNNQSYISILFRKKISFSISFGLLIFAFLFGIYRKMFASSIIISRFRSILADYNMSCDSNGRLIIKSRTTNREP